MKSLSHHGFPLHALRWAAMNGQCIAAGRLPFQNNKLPANCTEGRTQGAQN
jgi:hypothetical protein